MRYSIDSYIKIDDNFVPIGDVQAPLPDPRYVEGAIVWKIGSETLLSERHYDLVDQLWAYIVRGLQEIKGKREFKTYFPDQPLSLAFNQLGRDRIEVAVGEVRHVVATEPFFKSASEGGRRFFSRMDVLVPEATATWHQYLGEIDNLMSRPS